MKYILFVAMAMTLVMCKNETKPTVEEKAEAVVEEVADEPRAATDELPEYEPGREVVGNVEGVPYTDASGKVYHIVQEIIDGAEFATVSYDDVAVQMPQSIRWKNGGEYQKGDHKLFIDKDKTMLFINNEKINLTKK